MSYQPKSEPPMRYFLPIVLPLVLSGCGGDSSSQSVGQEEGGDSAVWGPNSERLVIVQNNGNVMNPDERYMIYDYSRDTLTTEAKEMLSNMYTTDDNLSCVEDGITYEIAVTNGSGIEEKFYSSNRACNSAENIRYIDSEEIRFLIALLFTY